MRTVLKPCRFCGTKPKIRTYEGGVMIWCDNWDCEPPCTIWEKTEKAAREKWQQIYGEVRK